MIFRCVTHRLTNKHLAQLEIPQQFLSCLKIGLHNGLRHHVYKHVWTMFKTCYTMFITCLHKCLQYAWRHAYTVILEGHVWKHVNSLYETCLHKVGRHDYTMFKDTFTRCLMTFFNHIWKHAFTIFGDLFVSYLKACYVVHEDMFTKKIPA